WSHEVCKCVALSLLRGCCGGGATQVLCRKRSGGDRFDEQRIVILTSADLEAESIGKVIGQIGKGSILFECRWGTGEVVAVVQTENLPGVEIGCVDWVVLRIRFVRIEPSQQPIHSLKH